MPVRLISGISHRFQWLSQRQGQVTHVLLTRSPLIHPASWASPFDLHVLSTPPAFVLSQNQTLRQCQLALHRRNGKETDTTKNPETGASIRHQITRTKPTEVGRSPHRHQDPPPTNPTPERAEPASSRPSRHRLLGTLLSSQRTDAHPDQAHHPTRRQPFKLTRAPSSRSNHAVRDRRVRH